MLKMKKKGISHLFSQKNSAPGHKMRHAVSTSPAIFISPIRNYVNEETCVILRSQVWESIKGKYPVDAYGPGVGKPVKNKTEALQEYKFSIIIENDKDQFFYFSEKIVDAFISGTVPVLWGHGQ